MSRIITAISIFILVIALAVFETVYITNKAKEVVNEIEKAREYYDIYNLEMAEKSIKKADKIWEDNTEIMNAFLVHDNTDEVSERIATADVTLKYQSERFPIECANATDSLNIIIYSMLPQIDNIL